VEGLTKHIATLSELPVWLENTGQPGKDLVMQPYWPEVARGDVGGADVFIAYTQGLISGEDTPFRCLLMASLGGPASFDTIMAMPGFELLERKPVWRLSGPWGKIAGTR
jgi:hypothetical protein